MHYMNGREAHEGDHVIYRSADKLMNGEYHIVTGVLHSLNAGATTCNAQIAYKRPYSDQTEYITVGRCLHVEDAWAMFDALAKATADIIWMPGSPSFGPEGEAHEGWLRVRESLEQMLDLLGAQRLVENKTDALP